MFNGCVPPVSAGIINKTKSCADSGQFLSIISGQWSVHESNNKTEFDSTFGKNISFIQVSKWFDVSLFEDFEAIIKTLFAINMVSCTLRLNVPLGSFNTTRSRDNNLSLAKIIGYIV